MFKLMKPLIGCCVTLRPLKTKKYFERYEIFLSKYFQSKKICEFYKEKNSPMYISQLITVLITYSVNFKLRHIIYHLINTCLRPTLHRCNTQVQLCHVSCL